MQKTTHYISPKACSAQTNLFECLDRYVPRMHLHLAIYFYLYSSYRAAYISRTGTISVGIMFYTCVAPLACAHIPAYCEV